MSGRLTLEQEAERDTQRAIRTARMWDDIFTQLFDPPNTRTVKCNTPRKPADEGTAA